MAVPVSAAEWVIGEPKRVETLDSLWELRVSRSDNLPVIIYADRPAECLRLAHLFRAAEAMQKALEKIALGRGDFDLNPMNHAKNTIDAMKGEARAALRLATPQDTP